MLTAMTAVDNLVEGRIDKSNIWAVNTKQDYREFKATEACVDRAKGEPAAQVTV